MMIESIHYPEANLASCDYRLAPDVVFLRIQDGSARLLNLRGNFYALSRTGAHMLNETLREGIATAALHIATLYRTELSLVQRDLHAFLRNLEEKELIYRVGQHPRVIQDKNALPQLLLPPLLHFILICPLSLEKKSWSLLTLASLAIRLFGWPKTIASWHAYLQKYAPRCVTGELEPSVHKIDNAVRRVAACHPFHVECKERALCCWWFLSSAGFSTQLVVGVSLFPLECHCWCEAGQFIISDDRGRCERFTPVLSYGCSLK